MKKLCKVCQSEKDETEFYEKAGATCKSCRIERSKAYYLAHHDERKAWHRRHAKTQKSNLKSKKRARREWIKKLKAKPCADCDNDFPPECMDFDHRDRTKKLFGIAAAINTTRSRAAIRREIAKCDLICANCHRIRTAKQMGWM